MTTYCYAMVRGEVARFTRLDSCGRPVEGEESVVVTSGLSVIRINEIVDTKNPELIRSERDDPRLLLPAKTRTIGYSADLTLTKVDPDLIWLLTGRPRVENYDGDTVGNDATLHLPTTNFAMEVWSKLAKPVDGYGYGYTLFPRIRGGRVGGFSINNGAINFSIEGAKTIRGAKWGVGPYSLRWTPAGWDMGGWDEDPWDEDDPRCVKFLNDPPLEGFGELPFGETPFGGYVFPIHERLGTEIGSHTHWRHFLLDWAPSPMIGAQPLYDVIDNEFADPLTQDSEIVEGEYAYTGDDVVDGGTA